jgi:hypothetical protein
VYIQQVIELLERSRNLLAKPGGWCQLVAATNKAGASVFADSPYAVSFCATGVLLHCHPTDELLIIARLALLDVINSKNPDNQYDFLSGWNDEPNRTQDEVVNTFNEAIEYLKIR